MMQERVRRAMVSPYRFFVIAAVLAALLSMLPTHADAPDREGILASAPEESEGAGNRNTAQQSGVPAGADLTAKTQEGAYLHRTMTYTCGHSVQRREPLPVQLVGLTHDAMKTQIADAVPSGRITGFAAQEVDVAQQMEIPCPLHWVLRLGEDGRLAVWQNMTGETLEVIRNTDVARELLSEENRQELLAGVTFDDAQALEGYLESLSS